MQIGNRKPAVTYLAFFQYAANLPFASLFLGKEANAGIKGHKSKVYPALDRIVLTVLHF